MFMGYRMFSPGFPLLLLENKRESELPGETKGGEEENPNHANLSAGTIVVEFKSCTVLMKWSQSLSKRVSINWVFAFF